ncbi:hypothetical protein [Bradyrhizobium sp.]
MQVAEPAQNNRVSGNCQRNLPSLDAPAIDDYLERRGRIMATMISEVYDAFLASGTPEDKARKAAEAMAAYDGRFNGIEHDLGMMRGDINVIRGDVNIVRGDINTVRGEINTVRGEINLLKWMNGITWALCFGIIFKLFLR